LPLLLLRPWALFGGADAVQVCYLGSELATVGTVLVLALTYSFIAPAILPVCAIFFGVASLVYRFLFTHVYEAEFDGAGTIWFHLFRSVIVGLFLGSLVLVAIFGVQATRWQALSISPLPIIVIVFAHHCSMNWAKESALVSMADAISVDKDDHTDRPEFSESLYIDPELLPQSESMCQNTEATSIGRFATQGLA